MDKLDAIEVFAALAHDTRLEVFRLLIKKGADGMAAGDLAIAMEAKQNTMSANLAVLSRSGLIVSERQGRSIIYRANFNALRGLLAFLMEDCCGGNPALCQPILDEIACAC